MWKLYLWLIPVALFLGWESALVVGVVITLAVGWTLFTG